MEDSSRGACGQVDQVGNSGIGSWSPLLHPWSLKEGRGQQSQGCGVKAVVWLAQEYLFKHVAPCMACVEP